VLVLNQELRFHHTSGLGAAFFWDAGNIFEKGSDLGFNLRHALGFGLRWDSPVGLLRMDLGFPWAARPARTHTRSGSASGRRSEPSRSDIGSP
jgi:outer membrane translocation and assembly module TamA